MYLFNSWNYYESIRDKIHKELNEIRRKREGGKRGGRMMKQLIRNMSTDSDVKKIGSRIITNILIGQGLFLSFFFFYHFVRGFYFTLQRCYKFLSDFLRLRIKERMRDGMEERKEKRKEERMEEKLISEAKKVSRKKRK